MNEDQNTPKTTETPTQSVPQQPTQQQPVRPAMVVNGQTVQSSIPTPLTQPVQSPTQKPSKWRYFFIILGILQILGVVAFFGIIALLAKQAKAGVSGTEFVGLFVFVTLIPAIALVAFINLIGLPLYMRRHKPQGKGLIVSIVSLTISILLVLGGAYSLYQAFYVAPKRTNELSRQAEQKMQAKQQQYVKDNAKPEIAKDEAITLLNTCQLSGFYYTNQTDRDGGNWGELSSTGVVLTKIDGKPYRISIADSLVSELVPIAREAQKTCGGPQFWHDGNYEQWQDGHWYFNGTVVN